MFYLSFSNSKRSLMSFLHRTKSELSFRVHMSQKSSRLLLAFLPQKMFSSDWLKLKFLSQVYKKLDTQGVIDAQKILHCCDWAIEDQSNATATTCKKTIGCWDTQASRALCPSCQSTIKEVVNSGFNGSGGVGLFFAFTEVSLNCY